MLDFDNHYSMGLSPRDLGWAEMADMDRWDNGDSRRVWHGQRAQKPMDLMSALKKSPAKVVILAICSSATIPWGLSQANFNAKGVATWRKKIAGGPAVIVTYSPHFKTLSFNWGHALAAFLLDLIDYEVVYKKIVPRKLDYHGTIQQALDAANLAFKNNHATDTFVLVNGSGSTVVFPDRPLSLNTYADWGLDWENDPDLSLGDAQP